MQLTQNSIWGFPQPVIRPQWTHDKRTHLAPSLGHVAEEVNDGCFDWIQGEIRGCARPDQHACAVDSAFLIQGETSTGKEVFAQAIHQARPRRQN
jgi:transcriptional regulator of acetoin/glycerol metabolism